MYAAIVLRMLIRNYNLVFEGGTDGLGNAAVVQNLELVITILIAGIAETVMPIAAAYDGEKNRCGTHMVRRSAIVLGYMVLLPVATVLMLFPNSFIRLFVEDNVYMFETLPTAVRISMAAFLFSMFAQIQQSYYSSVEEERTATIAGIIQMVFQILSLIVLPAFTPRNAAWFSLFIGALMASVYVILFKNGLEGVLRFSRGDTIYMTGAVIDTSKTAMNAAQPAMDAVRAKDAPLYAAGLI